MAKSIKKALKYIGFISGVLAILLLAFYLLLQAPAVQTFIVHKVSDKISKAFNSTIQVGSIEYKFFNRLIINDLLIKDQNNDTLLYIEKTIAGIRNYYRRENSVKLGKIYLIKPEFALITDSTGLMNLRWYLDKLKKSPDIQNKKRSRISADRIDFHEARFSLLDKRTNQGKSKINFSNLSLGSINGSIDMLRIENDTASFSIHNLSFNESTGFRVKEFSSALVISKGSISFSKAFLTSENSILNIDDLNLLADSTGSFNNFIEKVNISAHLEKSLVSTTDLKYFIPVFRQINESLFFSGRVSGTVSELRGRNILISYRDHSRLDCEFDISGLPDINNSFIYLGVNKLITNATDLEKISIPENRKLELPGLLFKLGNISFDGSFTGFITDFVTYGHFRSEFGTITTDLSMRPEARRRYRIKGLMNGNAIDLGELSEKRNLLGNMSFRTNIDGYASSMKKFTVDLTGNIDSLQFKDYTYRDIALEGLFTERAWDGSIKISDKNVKMDFLGLFNFEKKLPEFDFTLNIANAKLYNLNLDKSDTTSSATLLLTSNFSGNTIDNLDGEIRLLNSNFIRYGNNLELYDFSVKTYVSENNPVLRLRSDFVDAELTGPHKFSEFGKLFKYLLSRTMPLMFPADLKQKDINDNNFSFKIKFKNSDEINNFLHTGFRISENSYIEGDIYPDSLVRIYCNSKKLSVYNNIFNDFVLSSGINDNELGLGIQSSSLELLRQSKLDNFRIDFNSKADNFMYSVNWGGLLNSENKGSFIARGNFSKKDSAQENAILNIVVDSSEFYSRSKLWKVRRSTIIVDSNAVKINRFLVGTDAYFYSIDGSVSKNPADTLKIGFKGIDITPLNYIITRNKNKPEEAFSPEFRGQLNGRIFIANLYRELQLVGNLSVENFGLLDTDYGILDISSALDINNKVINISAKNNLQGKKMLEITGFYDPPSRKLDLTGVATKLSIKPLNKLLKVFASDISGTATGKVNLIGQPGSIVLTGAVLAENSSLKIDYLQTKYKLNDSIRFDRKGINFNNIRLNDEKGNPATLSGLVSHKNFKNFESNITINVNDCMVLNTRPKDNELFYGTAYATGVTTIKSTKDGALEFDISARSGRNTRFYIPLNTSLSVSDVSFVTFVDTAADTLAAPSTSGKLIPVPPKTSGFDLKMDLEVTPAAEVQLIFDMTVGDIMKATGSGDLNISYNKKGEFRITGDYIIDNGDYLFTLQNILNKPFSVENGGKIMFNGDIYDAEIDLKAIYKLRASLADIIPPEMASNERVPVECQINLTGKLFNPFIRFDIYLPTADEKTRTIVRNAIVTDEQMSRQFLYLLVMNSFYPDPAMTSGPPPGSGTAGTAAAVTTSEMLFSQLSNMLSKISNDFDIGVVYRPGVGSSEINSDQLEVALSKQILNDKVIINGNFDVRGSNADPNTNQITGDFDAEVKLTDRIRLKVFNRYNNPYTGKTEPYTQGVGVFFRQEFNKISDLFSNKNKSDIKKEEELKIKKEKNK